MTTIFISYRRQDNPAAAGRISDRLKSHFGKRKVTLDVDSIPAGVDFREYIRAEVAKCDVLLVIIGDKWLELMSEEDGSHDTSTDWAKVEIEAALDRGIPVVPVLVQSAKLAGKGQLPESIAELSFRNAVEVRAGASFDGQIAHLIQRIESAASKPKRLRKAALTAAGVVALIIVGFLVWLWYTPNSDARRPVATPALKTLGIRTSQAAPSVSRSEKATIYIRVSDSDGRRLSGAKVILESGGGRFLDSPNERYNPNDRLHGPYSTAGLTTDTGVFTATWVCNPCARGYGMTARVSKTGYNDASAELTVKIE